MAYRDKPGYGWHPPAEHKRTIWHTNPKQAKRMEHNLQLVADVIGTMEETGCTRKEACEVHGFDFNNFSAYISRSTSGRSPSWIWRRVYLAEGRI